MTYVKGIQVSYGKFSNGEIVEAVSLNSFGDLNQASSLCTHFYIPQGDYLASIVYRYTDSGISQVRLTTNNGKDASYGNTRATDASIVNQFN